MSPLILVGLLTVTALSSTRADVKHVLEGSAHPPGCTLVGDNQQHHHHHHHQDSAGAGSSYTTSGSFGSGASSSFNANGAGSNGVPGSVAFWWADSNSPFKHAYEYFKKCSLKGNCLPPVAPGVQLPNNLPQNCNGNGCTVSGSFEYKTQSDGSQFGPIDVKKNIFLNGQYQGQGGAVSTVGAGCSGAGCKEESGHVYFSSTTKGSGAGIGGGCNGANCGGSTQGSFNFQGQGQGGAGVGCSGAGCKEGQFGFNGQGQGTTAGFGSGCSGSGCKTESGQFSFSSQSSHSQSHSTGQTIPGCSGAACTTGSGQFAFNGQKQGSGQINLGSNPFFNGGVTVSGTTGTSSHSQSHSTGQTIPGCSGAACTTGSGQFAFNGQKKGSGQINLGSNPFFNGGVTVSGTTGTSGTTSNSGSGSGHIDISGNPFLGGHSSTQSAYSGNGEAVVTGSDGFLGVQPAVPFGKNTQPFPTAHPGISSSQGSLQYSFEHSSQPGAQPFPTAHPSNDGKYQNCKESGYVCVSQQTCVNGVVSNPGFVQQKNSAQCIIGKEVCCRLPQGGVTPPGSSTYSFATTASRTGFANLSDITAGKSSVPGSVIKFGGGAGLSAGSIKVLTVDDGVPNPLVSSAGESGSGVVHTDSLNSIKVVRNTSPNPNGLNPFSSTIDYSNDKLDQLTFISTTRGPEYLPPVNSISTYRPSIPTTSKPVIPGISIVSTSSPKPFDFPQAQNTVPSYTARPTFPTANSQYLPPKTSTFVASSTTKKPYYPTSSTNVNNKYVSKQTPYVSKQTGGYSYPTPTPTFGYPTTTTQKPYYPTSSTNVNNKYVPPLQPQPSQVTSGYKYPEPTPTLGYPTTTTTRRPIITTTTARPTYTTKKYVSPSISTSGYKYPTPSPAFEDRSPSVTVTQSTNVNNKYITPKTNNGYLPPVGPTLVPSGSGIGNNYVPPPYIPPDRVPDTSGKVVNKVFAGCAAALKCVEEQYCTADGFISATAVVLTREQDLARVPTTDCTIETGGAGKCCRDANYVDPWPSANLINGEDDGQYREDPTLGQYFPQKQRPARSGISSNANAVANNFGSPSGQNGISANFGKNSQAGVVPNGQGALGGSFVQGSTVSGSGKAPGSGNFGGSFGQGSSGFEKTSQFGLGVNGQNAGGAGLGGGFAHGSGSSSFEKSSQFGLGANGQNAGAAGLGGGFAHGSGSSSFEKSSQFGLGANGQNAGAAGLGGGFAHGSGSSSFEKSSQFGLGANGQNAGAGNFGSSFGQGSFSSFEKSSHSGFGANGQAAGAGGFGDSSGFGKGLQPGFSSSGQAFGGSFGQGSSSNFGKSTSFFQQYSSGSLAGAGSQTCGVRNLDAQPRGPGPIDVGFGEIPWQAMVLRDSNRSLLCGGVIVQENAVLTYAHCVEGLETSDVLIKGGEWKLGIEDEPLAFQIVKVAAIIFHPDYQSASQEFDMALLMLEENLRLADNIAPICLPPANQPTPSVQQLPAQQCIVTGWGKRILQVHLRYALLRSIDVNPVEGNQCKEALASKGQSFASQYYDNTICGFSNNDQCDVDYGSALACTDGSGSYSLYGLFLWDTGCKDKQQVGAYVRPDYGWIQTTCSKPISELKALDRQYNHK